MTTIPTITPYNPKALPKISIISIFINDPLAYVSTRAAPEPIIPTQIPHAKLVKPTMNPTENIPYADLFA